MARLEIACFHPSSALLAAGAGADRIELCAGHAVGGTTPSLSTLQTLKSQLPLSVPVFVMIRPRGGDFAYSVSEFAQMRDDVVRFGELADGFVFGVLEGDGVDEGRCRELVGLAGARPCTFHRAFDECGDLEGALEAVVRCGFRCLLTSGGKASAVEGVEILEGLVRRAEGRIVVMPGGGVRAANVGRLREVTRASWFHSSGIVGEGEVASSEEVVALKQMLKESKR